MTSSQNRYVLEEVWKILLPQSRKRIRQEQHTHMHPVANKCYKILASAGLTSGENRTKRSSVSIYRSNLQVEFVENEVCSEQVSIDDMIVHD